MAPNLMRIDRSKSTPAKLRAPAQRVTSDPRPASDGLCVVTDCGKPRTRIAELNDDPFCSTVCCRRWYGCEL